MFCLEKSWVSGGLHRAARCVAGLLWRFKSTLPFVALSSMLSMVLGGLWWSQHGGAWFMLGWVGFGVQFSFHLGPVQGFSRFFYALKTSV